jgi:bile acid:Na+ symporter, BASS family
MRSITLIIKLFPLWAILFSVAAYRYPAFFTPMESLIVPLLVVIMFGMGMTLTAADFGKALRRPKAVSLGVLLQYSVMPLFAFAISRALNLSTELTVGMVLVGSVAGGTASNVICYLAKGDAALSITMTMVSTLLSVIATPALTWLYVGRSVPVPVASMLLSILKIVLAPVAAGVLINTLIGTRTRAAKPFCPLISMAAIVLIIGIVVGLNKSTIRDVGAVTVTAVILHNLLGLTAGYWGARLMGYDVRISRTVAIEVGMQNSGLGVALAIKYFSAAAALPGALFSVWHNLSGSLLAGYWAGRPHPCT